MDLQAPTDTSGAFAFSITVDRPATYDSIPCEFRAPDVAPLAVDTVFVRLYPFGVPNPQQFVHLRQPTQG